HMVPKTRTKPDGSIENYQEEETYYERWTSTYTESGSFTLDADYREVLGGHVSPSAGRVSSMLPSAQPRGMYAVSATNGSPTIDYVDNGKISRILDSAKVARAVEKPVRDEMDAVDDLTKKIAADYAKGDLAAKKDGYVKQIQAARD
ncbi:hypothetical protein, partial [Staphylococcus epidermidis]|uniref:hypothetical protein n=1 Tax=Staphylococcus epidermidis TaxID=1282 RepID=UPI002738F403